MNFRSKLTLDFFKQIEKRFTISLVVFAGVVVGLQYKIQRGWADKASHLLILLVLLAFISFNLQYRRLRKKNSE